MMIRLLLAAFISGSAQAAPPEAGFLADLELFKSRSLALRTEREKLGAQEAQKLSRLLQLTPSLSAGLGKSETRAHNDLTGASRASVDYWRLSADWNLFRGLGDLASWRAASLAEAAQTSQLMSQELKTELDGASAIFRWLYLTEAREAQQELLRLKKDTMRIGRDRFRQGKIPLQDVTKMEVDLAQQENAARQAEVELAENEVAYKAFFVDSLKTSRWPFAEEQEPALGEGRGSFATRGLRERAGALEQSWRAGRSRHWPSLDLAVSYREAPLRFPSTGTWSGTLELSLPLWSRFETAAANATAYGAFVEAEGQAATAERTDELRRSFLRKKIALSRASLREARLNLEKSRRLYDDMLRSFQLGRLSTNDLFQEQDRKVRARLLYAGSRLSFHGSLMEACALWGLRAGDCLR